MACVICGPARPKESITSVSRARQHACRAQIPCKHMEGEEKSQQKHWQNAGRLDKADEARGLYVVSAGLCSSVDLRCISRPARGLELLFRTCFQGTAKLEKAAPIQIPRYSSRCVFKASILVIFPSASAFNSFYGVGLKFQPILALRTADNFRSESHLHRSAS
jgi:hypothetical protein